MSEESSVMNEEVNEKVNEKDKCMIHYLQWPHAPILIIHIILL